MAGNRGNRVGLLQRRQQPIERCVLGRFESFEVTAFELDAYREIVAIFPALPV